MSSEVRFACAARTRYANTQPGIRRPTGASLAAGGGRRVILTPGPPRKGTGLFFTGDPNLEPKPAVTNTNSLSNPSTGVPLTVTVTNEPSRPPPPATYEQGFGGFPGTLQVFERLAARVAPRQVAELRRALTLNPGGVYVPLPPTDGGTSTGLSRTRTNQSAHRRHHHHREATLVQPPEENKERPPLAPPYMQNSGPVPEVPEHLRHRDPRATDSDTDSSDASSSTGWMSDLQELAKKQVTYLKQGVLKVGRNSDFNTDDLTDEQLEELGGIEFRALRALSWIVGLVGTVIPSLLSNVDGRYLCSTTS